MSRTFPRPSSFKPERVVSTTVVWLTLRTSDRAWLNFLLYHQKRTGNPGLSVQVIRAISRGISVCTHFQSSFEVLHPPETASAPHETGRWPHRSGPIQPMRSPNYYEHLRMQDSAIALFYIARWQGCPILYCHTINQDYNGIPDHLV